MLAAGFGKGGAVRGEGDGPGVWCRSDGDPLGEVGFAELERPRRTSEAAERRVVGAPGEMRRSCPRRAAAASFCPSAARALAAVARQLMLGEAGIVSPTWDSSQSSEAVDPVGLPAQRRMPYLRAARVSELPGVPLAPARSAVAAWISSARSSSPRR